MCSDLLSLMSRRKSFIEQLAAALVDEEVKELWKERFRRVHQVEIIQQTVSLEERVKQKVTMLFPTLGCSRFILSHIKRHLLPSLLTLHKQHRSNGRRRIALLGFSSITKRKS